jgi:hypothetical protein
MRLLLDCSQAGSTSGDLTNMVASPVRARLLVYGEGLKLHAQLHAA